MDRKMVFRIFLLLSYVYLVLVVTEAILIHLDMMTVGILVLLAITIRIGIAVKRTTTGKPSRAQRAILMGLMMSDQIYARDLAKLTGFHSGSIYPLLARLEDAGWLDHHPDERDDGRPRRTIYRLNSTGRVKAQELLAGEINLHALK